FAGDQRDLFGYPVAAAGGGALVAGLVCLLGRAEGRTLVLPPMVVGALFLTGGLLLTAADFDQDVVLTLALPLAWRAVCVCPSLPLSVRGRRADQLYSAADIPAGAAEIAPGGVAVEPRVAHEILGGISASVGLILALVAALALRLGM